MDTNGLPVAETAVKKPAPIGEGYAKWIEVKFDNVIFDSSMLARQNSIEAFYLGYLKAVDVIKKKKYTALFNWDQQKSTQPGCMDYTLTIFVSPPPSKDFPTMMTMSSSIVALDDPGDGSDGGGDDIDPPKPPVPPPPDL